MKFWQILGNTVGVIATVVSGGTALPITAPLLAFVNGVAMWEGTAYDADGNYINPTVINVDEVDITSMNALDIINSDRVDDVIFNLTDENTDNNKPWHLPFIENYANTDFNNDGFIGRPSFTERSQNNEYLTYGAMALALLLITNN